MGKSGKGRDDLSRVDWVRPKIHSEESGRPVATKNVIATGGNFYLSVRDDRMYRNYPVSYRTLFPSEPLPCVE